MICFEVPEIVPTPFVVATADPRADLAAFERIEPPLGPIVRDLLGTPLLEISTYAEAEFGLSALIAESGWTKPDELPVLEAVTHHVIVASHGPPTAQPQYAQAARAVARAVAAASDGIVYDVGSHQTFSRDFAAEPERQEFCLGDNWFSVFLTAGDDDGVDAATVGLYRFGLPDLEATDVPAEDCLSCIMLLRALAVGLLNRHWSDLVREPSARTLRLGGDEWVEIGDVWRYWGVAPPPMTDRIRVGLSVSTGVLADGSSAILTVGPPSATDARNWWREVVAPAMPDLARAPERAAV